ncbi:hypothetical protein H2200_004322 [Cladophialophora chaetospira]|uniref:Heterokaryon incompatibility domain-containing protein n=1 Tax=Cladophialophora chaetospira TaxID=386627 RepID=A0AA38XD21_9EURO|nr:hypothetical protein H2200_004322 [Cladophialophora chaetospira]
MFTALSYTWGRGTPDETRAIFINGQPFHVLANLHDFLCQLRARGCDHNLFADAISINQSDWDEKSQIVGLMGQIFSTADRVFAWLGGEASGSDEIIDHLNTHSPWFRGKLETRNTSPRNISSSLVPYYNPLTNSMDYGLSQNGDRKVEMLAPKDFWRKYFHLIERPYFSRLWVAHEILLAQNEVLFFAGNRIIAWSVLSTPAQFGSLVSPDNINYQTFKATSFARLQARKEANEDQSLESLLRDFGSMGCADLRDRIFALLGLLRGRHQRKDLQPDYSLDPMELFCSLVSHAFMDGNLVSTSILYRNTLGLKPHPLRKPKNDLYPYRKRMGTVTSLKVLNSVNSCKVQLELVGEATVGPLTSHKTGLLFRSRTLSEGSSSTFLLFSPPHEIPWRNDLKRCPWRPRQPSNFVYVGKPAMPTSSNMEYQPCMLFAGSQSPTYAQGELHLLLIPTLLPQTFPYPGKEVYGEYAIDLNLDSYLQILRIFEDKWLDGCVKYNMTREQKPLLTMSNLSQTHRLGRSRRR